MFAFVTSLLAHEIGKSAPCAAIFERSDMTNAGLLTTVLLYWIHLAQRNHQYAMPTARGLLKNGEEMQGYQVFRWIEVPKLGLIPA
jgi:hypothetical protein